MTRLARPRAGIGVLATLWIVSTVAWLVAAAAVVDIEYYDGLSAICNGRYFLGWSAFYLFDRGPLMAWLQMPAETVKGWLALHPLDLRANHFTMAAVHAGYLAAVYHGLVRQLGQQWSTLAAFAGAVTSYMFWSYAPFVSHDLSAGALFLWMLIWSEEVARAPRLAPWILLVAAGALGPLVKQTFGVLWIAVLAAHVAPTLLRHDPAQRTSARALAWLAAGAATSALLVWITYGVVLAGWVPEVPLWRRPYVNLQYLASVYDGTDVRFPVWIYARNAWAFGLLTTVLLLPALALALSGSRLHRRVAFAWLAAVVFIHAMPLREVRYLAFVAPLSAFLIAPVVRRLGRREAGLIVIGALLVLDLGTGLREAARVATPFYRHSELKNVLAPLSEDGPLRRPLYHNVSMLSFVAPGQSPLAADRYHRVFHAGAHQIGVLYGYAPSDVRAVLPWQLPALAATAPEGSALLFASTILAYGPAWRPAPPPGSESFVQGLATPQQLVLSSGEDGRLRTPAGRIVDVAAGNEDGHDALVVDQAEFELGPLGALLPTASVDGGPPIPLRRGRDGRLTVALPAREDAAAPPARLVLRWFEIQRRWPPTPSSADAR